MDALCIFASFRDRSDNRVGIDFQNFYAEDAKSHNGITYSWAGFGYSGASVNIDAASIEATLVFPTNELSLSVLTSAVTQEWLVEVETVWLDPETLATTSDRLTEFYSCIGVANDFEQVALRLGSALDAQTAELPARVLSRRLVGNLPATGAVGLR